MSLANGMYIDVKGSRLFGTGNLWIFIHFLYFATRWTNVNESIRSGMAVLDVTIPTGYWIQQQKLDAYILSRRVRNLQRARYLHNKVLFYFDYVRYTSNYLSDNSLMKKTKNKNPL